MRHHKHLWILLILFAALSFMMINSLSDYEEKLAVNTLKDLETTISRYALQCYATEGAYPPSIDYLVDHYGLIVNEDKYIYEYEAIADNIRPSITVHFQFSDRRSND